MGQQAQSLYDDDDELTYRGDFLNIRTLKFFVSIILLWRSHWNGKWDPIMR
jgi:hypothetical protein